MTTPTPPVTTPGAGHEYRVEPERAPVAAELRSRAARLREALADLERWREGSLGRMSRERDAALAALKVAREALSALHIEVQGHDCRGAATMRGLVDSALTRISELVPS